MHDWSELLKVAERIGDIDREGLHDESIWRSAINRAYYAAFLEARDTSGISANGYSNGVHADQVQYWKKTRPRVGSSLSDLLELRIRADYNPAPVSSLDRDRSIQLATTVFKHLKLHKQVTG